MAVYRFRVTFEDYDDISREIDIKSTHTFVDLHKAIHQSVGYDPEYSSSFYISNDQWTKGEELAYKPSERKVNRGVTLMENAKLAKFIDDPHQKFYYTSNFDRPFDFHVELMKILDEAPGATYPLTSKVVGEAPKQFGNVVAPASGTANAVSEDLDFLNEMEYNPEDTEHFSEVTEDGASDNEENEEEDEFSNEFSDDENYDEEERGGRGGRNDDY